MVFFEAIQALFTLNFQFFIDIIMGNLLWVFAFYVMIHIFFDGKKMLYWFVLWGFLLWAILDWEGLTGMSFTGAMFLLFYYTTKLALLAIVETTPALRKYMVLLSSVQAYVLILIFTFLVGGG
ncbi:MAG TPA: hypothetical protein HA254_03945 [Candidatus Diapherotrites archaeon]|uniref:Uncharacterized protein n=1 Tax=Candidatus Iainarchaeum sp. TaxID=3101447 RepID=A0A7J4J160_9ARCH|nr:hypothetical protein [Candidatus Diapherotrites archaeon]